MNQDTKERLMGGAIAFIMLLFVWVFCGMVLGAIDASGQEYDYDYWSNKQQTIDTSREYVKSIDTSNECDHTSDAFERFALIRFLPPAIITSYNAAEKKIYYRISTAREVRIGSFDIESDTVFDQNLADNKSYVFLIYCAKDLHLYFVTPLSSR